MAAISSCLLWGLLPLSSNLKTVRNSPHLTSSAALPRVPVLQLLRSLGVLVLPNPGHGDCLAYAINHASYGYFPVASIRQRAQSFIANNPNVFAVRNLTAAERGSLGINGEWLTDNQAKVISVALQSDFLILDTPSSIARYMEHGAGNVTCLDYATCRAMMLSRRHDDQNPLRIIKYIAGHYEGVCWPP